MLMPGLIVKIFAIIAVSFDIAALIQSERQHLKTQWRRCNKAGINTSGSASLSEPFDGGGHAEVEPRAHKLRMSLLLAFCSFVGFCQNKFDSCFSTSWTSFLMLSNY